MSPKPCSSNSEASHSADSTRASGVAFPYLASSRGSSDPALTPIRIGMPAPEAAFAISLTLSSNLLMLPGFTRTPAQPASIAAKTYFGWKWMSAITGICDLRAIAGSASTSSCEGTATRTIWHPAAVNSAICCRVALTSAVSVVVIDCTDTGAPPPTATPPTRTWRDVRRVASGAGGTAGIPRPMTVIATSRESGRVAGLEDHGQALGNEHHPGDWFDACAWGGVQGPALGDCGQGDGSLGPGDGFADAASFAGAERDVGGTGRGVRAAGPPPVGVEAVRVGVEARIAVHRVGGVADGGARGDEVGAQLDVDGGAAGEQPDRRVQAQRLGDHAAGAGELVEISCLWRPAGQDAVDLGLQVTLDAGVLAEQVAGPAQGGGRGLRA